MNKDNNSTNGYNDTITVEPACSRIVYILLGIFLGNFGVHNFIAGRTSTAIKQLCLNFLGMLLAIVGIGVLISLGVSIWVIYELFTVKIDGNGVEMD